MGETLNDKRIGVMTGAGLFFFFCLFVLVHQQGAYRTARMHIASHARVIAHAVWNYNSLGAEQYLQLAAHTYH